MAESKISSESNEVPQAPADVSNPPGQQATAVVQLGAMFQGPVQLPMLSMKHIHLHRKFGTIHILVGLVLIILESAGLIIGPLFFQYGNGVYSGIPLFVTGIMLKIAANKENRCCLIAGLTLEMVSIAALLLSIGFASDEVDWRKFCYAYCGGYKKRVKLHDFQLFKAILVIFFSCLGILLATIHSGYSCHDLCLCCRNKMIPPVIYTNEGQVIISMNQTGEIVRSMPSSNIVPLGRVPNAPGSAELYVVPSNQNEVKDTAGETYAPPAYDTLTENEKF